MRWIKFSDKEPKVGEAVLYYFEIMGIDVGTYEGDGLFVHKSGRNFLTGDVTHWMLLPPPPAE
ncbi:DUF551 domain-containing protein [Rosenbergiella epipactidis]|uniref:DUF551 domain-containing protein n=1 Tax=Rosenbergiella epipactidis TaxID=1544694 RepID=UPI001F4E65F6|nr:DUF551 domain-containing protein [Rosenbergiella epipactidis]